MTLDPRDLYAAQGSVDRRPLRRQFSDLDIKHRPIASDGAGATLLANLLMGYNSSTGFWEPWDQDGAPGEADEVRAILYRDTKLSATGEVVGELIMRGKFHIGDINTSALRAQMQGSPSSNDVIAACADANTRSLDLEFEGVLQP